MDTDDIDSPRPIEKPQDLQRMSIGELREYVASLKAEISRAEDMIEKKQAHKSGIESLFGK